jgi:hypothetical protein
MWVLDLIAWNRTDLLHQSEQVRLAMFFDDLPVRKSIEIHRFNFYFRSCGWNAKEIPLMRPSHSEASSDRVTLRDHLL